MEKVVVLLGEGLEKIRFEVFFLCVKEVRNGLSDGVRESGFC